MQIGTENGFVLSYEISAHPTDTRTLLPHLQSFLTHYGRSPTQVIADKGYGSYENYRELENRNIQALIKYPHRDQEQKKRSKRYRYRSWRFSYDEQHDQLQCPEGKRLSFLHEAKRTNYDKSAQETVRIYQCDSCHQCPQRKQCTDRPFRRVELNPDRLRLYRKARDRLKTEEGWQLYRARGMEVETVFGQIKGNIGYRRFLTWGQQNTSCEWGLHMIGYNCRRLAARLSCG